jgi:hypothetical protein
MIYLLKIITLGSTHAIVLPAPLLSALDIDRGDIVALRPNKLGGFRLDRISDGALDVEQRVIAPRSSVPE